MVPPMRRAIALIALAAAMLAPHPARATPPDLFGLGPRTQAMGMTGTSYADDYEAVYANPAGLARARRVGIHLGLSAASLRLTVDGVRDPVAPASTSGSGSGTVAPSRIALAGAIGSRTPSTVRWSEAAESPRWIPTRRARARPAGLA